MRSTRDLKILAQEKNNLKNNVYDENKEKKCIDEFR